MEKRNESLPQILIDYIDALVKRAGGGSKVRLDIREELWCHFVDALAGLENEQVREKSARELIESFGDMNMLAKLIKRGKKRCRPLWQKVLLRSLFVLCALIVGMVVYAVWFLMGSPAPSVDYLARLNTMTQPAAAAAENAWPHYEKAIALYVEPEEVDKARDLPEAAPGNGLDEAPERTDNRRLSTVIGGIAGGHTYTPFGRLKPEEQAAVSTWLDRNEEAWKHYLEASRKTYCYRPYDVGDAEGHPMLRNVLLPHLGSVRNLARVGVWRSERQAYENKAAEAVETCLTLLRAGRHWHQEKGTLIEQLVGQAIMRLGLEQIIVTTAQSDFSADQLAAIQRDLAAICTDGFPTTAMDTERLMFEDTVQHSFTKGGPGGGHIAPKAFNGMIQEFIGGGDELAYLSLGLHAGRDRTLKMGSMLYDRMEQIVAMSPYHVREGAIEKIDTLLEADGKWRYALLRAMIPGINRVGEMRYQSKALYEATLTILAAKRWQRDKGTLPENLEQLKNAGYIAALPADPYSADPLKYNIRDGDFVLYSVGSDFDDDGGTRDVEHVWGRAEPGADRVFWPVN
ncbi:MAG: hypothetical protein IH624_15735 [Phycisphaerae bacterium]|nr:hypothetical protein [Phycisphaerae bacterium]